MQIWVIHNQFGRRNLSAYQRSVLALKLKELLEVRAKEKEQLRKIIQQTKPIEIEDLSPVNKAIIDVLSKYKKNAYANPDKIYFIHSGDKVKIGCSSDIESRLKDVTKHLPNTKLIGFCAGGISLEKDLHKVLKSHLVNNEWFKLNNHTVSVIKAFLPDADFDNIDKVRSRQESSEHFKISEGTIAKVKIIEEKASPEQKAKFSVGNRNIKCNDFFR